MKIQRLTVFYEPQIGRRKRVGTLAEKNRRIFFQYDAEFLGMEIDLSPLKLPRRPDVFEGDPRVFDGLMGVFDDSLPDGWGRLVLDRLIAERGLEPAALGPLDRLAWVGGRSMGALSYEPEQTLEEPATIDLRQLESEVADLENASAMDLERLVATGGSPQGARPKALVQLSTTSSKVLYGARNIAPGFIPYMVKLRAKDDDRDAGPLEYAYARMAISAGINMPDTKLLCRDYKHSGFFAVRRFDRDASHRAHLHTLAGLLQIDPRNYGAVSYREMLLLTRKLTRNEASVRELFRRACFNVLAHNRDDHSRNFSFLMTEDGAWTISPAYDLTFSRGPGGEHAMLIAGEGRNPTVEHLMQLAMDTDLKRPSEIIDEVWSAMARFEEFAEEAGVRKKTIASVARALRLENSRKKRAHLGPSKARDKTTR